MTNGGRHDGIVVILGAGPGDAGLLTRAGANWLTKADCVVYDRLASGELLGLCREDAELIYVGKRPGGPRAAQDDINRLLIGKCRAGKLVVRLKGGDPLVFGRGGEEAEALATEGLAFRVVPGVTAAAAAAYAGIPLTDRRLASTVTFVTGREDPAKPESRIDWDALAKLDTLVFYMAVGTLEETAQRLVSAGRAPETPAAVIERASQPRQRTVVGTLATIAAKAGQAQIEPPAIVIVGRVVSLRERLAWFEKLPLFGRTVLVTRARPQAQELSTKLAEHGAEVVAAPAIEIRPPESFNAVDSVLRRLGEFDWLALTSPNGAASLLGRLRALRMDGRALAGVRVAVVGEATAEAFRHSFIEPDLVPETYTTRALGEALCALGVQGRRVLLARSDIAGPELPDALRAAGALVEEASVYRTTRPAALPDEALAALRAGRADWITFTSASTVDNFLALLPDDVDVSASRLAAIGPATAKAIRSAALSPTIIARPHAVDGLVSAIISEEASAAQLTIDN